APDGSSQPDDFTADAMGVEWEITALVVRDQEGGAAVEAAAGVDLDVAWKEWQLAQEGRSAAYGVMALEAQLAAARQADEQLAENLDLVRRAVDRHEKTLLDLAAAEASATDAYAIVIAQEKDLAHQKLSLNRALGL